MHLPQTLITVMHRTRQDSSKPKPKGAGAPGLDWSGAQSWCPCSESARLIQLIFAKACLRVLVGSGAWDIEKLNIPCPHQGRATHTLYWHSTPEGGGDGGDWCTFECTLGCEWFLKNDSRAWSVWFHLVRQHNCMYPQQTEQNGDRPISDAFQAIAITPSQWNRTNGHELRTPAAG